VSALEVVGGIMPALGIAMLLNYLGKRSLIPWFFAVFFLTVYSGVSLMAISIFSAIIAILLYIRDRNSNNQNKKTANKRKGVRRLSVDQSVEMSTTDGSASM
ncbi:PTS sugar transporter subunit IIC, partial [Lacticaseibacillus paracasei]